MFTRNALLVVVILSICLLCFSGCGGGSSGGGGAQGGASGIQSGSGNKGTILITAPFPMKAGAPLKKQGIVTPRVIPLTVYIYVVTVCERGTTTAVVPPVNINRPDSGDSVDATISSVPTGWKTVRISAYDSGRNILAEGSSDVEVKSTDQGSSDVSVTLASTSDPPSVSSTTPTNAQTGVSINTKVTVLFSMTMLESSLTADNFYLQSSQGKVTGTVSTDGSTAIFTPSGDLLPLTVYTAVVSGNVQNATGLSMGTEYSWTFTTGEKPDTTPPKVSETSPTSGALNVDAGTTISAVFTKSIDPATVTSATFTVNSAKSAVRSTGRNAVQGNGKTAVQGTSKTAVQGNGKTAVQGTSKTAVQGTSKTAVQGTITTLGNSVSFIPNTSLQAGIVHTVTLSGAIKDLAGNAMGTDYTWSFTTKASGGGGGGGGGGGSTHSWHRDIPKPTFETLNDVYYVSTTEAYAVGDNRVIVKYDGTGWKPMPCPVASVNLNSVRFFDSTHGYAVGSGGTVLFYNGSAWSDITAAAGVESGITLWGIEGNGNSNFFIAGTAGTIRMYNGSIWTNKDVASGPDFLGVWCDASDAIAVGTGGSIYHLSGGPPWAGSFSQEAIGLTSNTLTSVWATAYTDLHIAGYSGTYIYNDGTYHDYSSTTGASTHDLKSIWRNKATSNIYAAGCGGLIISTPAPGTAWTQMASGTSNELRGMSGLNVSPEDTFAVGYNGTVVHYDGSAWSLSPGTTLDLNAVWADSSTGKAIAVGNSGTALLFDSGAWSSMYTNAASYNFIGVWGADSTNGYAVADNSGATVFWFSGSTWSSLGDAGAAGFVARDIWGRSSSEVYVVGYTGAAAQVFCWDDGTWNQVGADIAGFDGSGIWGPPTGSDLYISGNSAGTDRIYQYSGGAWACVYNNGSVSLKDIWGLASGTIWSVGWMGDAVYGGGTTWNTSTTGTSENLAGVWGDCTSNFFAVGSNGIILHYGGSSWTSQSSGVSHNLKGVTGITNSYVFATGTNGTVLRYY